ncbi:MAG: AP2 domain-containing protein [Reichenbachiella sp.]
MREEITREACFKHFTCVGGILYWKVAVGGVSSLNKRAGSVNSKGYLQVGLKGERYYNHRIIFFMYNKFLPKFIDHIDGDPLNNHPHNLRACDMSTNRCNSKMNSNNTSGIKGVSWDKGYGKWMAAITLNKRRVYLEYFDTLEEAGLKIKLARLNVHKDFARDK